MILSVTSSLLMSVLYCIPTLMQIKLYIGEFIYSISTSYFYFLLISSSSLSRSSWVFYFIWNSISPKFSSLPVEARLLELLELKVALVRPKLEIFSSFYSRSIISLTLLSLSSIWSIMSLLSFPLNSLCLVLDSPIYSIINGLKIFLNSRSILWESFCFECI